MADEKSVGRRDGKGAGWVALITSETIGSTRGMGYAIISCGTVKLIELLEKERKNEKAV